MVRAGHPGHPDTGPESGVVRQPQPVPWSGVMQDNQFRQTKNRKCFQEIRPSIDSKLIYILCEQIGRNNNQLKKL